MPTDKISFYIRTLFFIVLGVNLFGLINPLFMGDSALYACISKEIVVSGNWMDLYVKGLDWLDKPHFPFWVAAISFKVFGVSVLAYKLPAIVFFMLSVLFTWKLAKLLYSEKVAWLSVLILGSALHIIISNNDVRAEPFLMGTLIPAMYYFVLLYKRYTFSSLMLGSAFAAMAIMTKGYFVMIPIVVGICGHALATGEWRSMLHWRWLAAVFLTILFITPELYALYSQFDRHPEKEVFGMHGVSGLRFFLWDSQFGRFFNNGPITGNGEPTFFIHTMLWAYAPWGLLGFASIYVLIKRWYKKMPVVEFFNLFAFLSMFLVFSVSKFQLPHYTNIIFPFISIVLAWYLYELVELKTIKRIAWIQYIFMGAFVLLAILVQILFQPGKTVFFSVITMATIGMAVYILRQKLWEIGKIVLASALFSVFFGLFLNVIFYPALLPYQGGKQTAFFITDNYPQAKVISLREMNMYDFEFYLPQKLYRINKNEFLQKPEGQTLLFVTKEYLDELADKEIAYKTVFTIPRFHITLLRPDFLNAKTRLKTLHELYLVELLP